MVNKFTKEKQFKPEKLTPLNYKILGLTPETLDNSKTIIETKFNDDSNNLPSNQDFNESRESETIDFNESAKKLVLEINNWILSISDNERNLTESQMNKLTKNISKLLKKYEINTSVDNAKSHLSNFTPLLFNALEILPSIIPEFDLMNLISKFGKNKSIKKSKSKSKTKINPNNPFPNLK